MDVSPSSCVPGFWAVEHGSTQLLNAQCSMLNAHCSLLVAGCQSQAAGPECAKRCYAVQHVARCCKLSYDQLAGQHAAWSTIAISIELADAALGCTV
jgi:hypothetical protein